MEGSSILGIHHSGQTTSAALILNGIVVGAVAEERLTRKKQDRSFPHNAIDWCLTQGKVSLEELTAVAIAWNAGENASRKYRAGFSDWMRYPGEWLSSVPNHLLTLLPDVPHQSRLIFQHSGSRAFDIRMVDHHASHLELTYQISGKKNAAFMTADGWSEDKVTVLGEISDGNRTILRTKHFPHSLGCFYAAFTEFLGYRIFSDEWRVMGMSAYGDSDRFYEKVRLLINILPEGDYELNLNAFDFYNFDRDRFFGPLFLELFGQPRSAEEEIKQFHYDLAAAVQRVFEEIVIHCLHWLSYKTNKSDLLLSGGCFMNCLANAKCSTDTPFDNVQIGFAAEDSGNSIGAAMLVSEELGVPVSASGLTSQLGPSYSEKEIRIILENSGLNYQPLKSVVNKAVDLLMQDKVIGWFQGKSEFGPRALGGRSILASPFSSSMKELINAKIKYRESYRPFAPILPLEEISNYFEIEERCEVSYMEKAISFKDEVKNDIPAVVHADGTGRLQTVSRKSNELLWSLLQKWKSASGHPVLINTSFNLNGEPIVCSPEDAIRTFVTSGLDALIMENLLLEKGRL